MPTSIMEKDLKNVPSFDDLVFENRNKEYGAYKIRKKYNRTVLWAMLVGVIIISTAVVAPYVMATVNQNRIRKEEKVVQAQMENLDQPQEQIAPPPPPPPPAEEQQAQVKYVAPVIVDSVKNEDKTDLATMDDAKETVQDDAVVEVVEEVKEEVQEEAKEEEQVFMVVEEMPSFGSGDANDFRAWVGQNMNYPEVAAENGIQGRVFVQFVVEPDGSISNVRVLRGVDPALDKEAVRVVQNSPKWNPGKQRGKPVRVSYTFPITFVLQ